MKSLQEWFDEYAVSHRNMTNQRIHYICVPLIFFSIVGLLMSIPPGPLHALFPRVPFYIANWAVIVLIPVLLFYLRLSFSMAVRILLFAALCVALCYAIWLYLPLWLVSLLIFIVAWIGQFYGHKVEGQKPSFLKDLQFLLIGPAWVIHKLSGGSA